MSIKKTLEDFDKEFNGTCNHEGKTRIDYEEINKLKQFITKEIEKALNEMKDDKSLEDESNGRYNREMELRENISNYIK